MNIFQNSKWKQEYAVELNNRFKMMENMEDEDHIDNNINKKLENIKTNQGNKTTANRKG